MMNKTTKKAVKKTTNRKKAVHLKTMYALVNKNSLKFANDDRFLDLMCPKENLNHTINSYLAHEGSEADMKNMLMVKMEIIGTPLVKTTRNITIK